MKNREVAIKLSGVKKQYRLGQIGGGTLQKDLQSWWARVRKKEDPNSKIGQEQRLVGETFMALNGIDLTIYKGEAIGIIGGNGAGKSTMLKLLSRVTAPSEGTIDLYGRVASMLEVGTGFNGEMTGRENVYMNGAILGMTKAEIDAKMEDIIEFSEVRDFIDTPVKRYSSGMYVKLAFSVAAHLDSEIMIMDEVLAVGDMAFQKKCLDKMREAASKEGRTVLYVSHNMSTIRSLCDRCIVLNQGRVIYEGDVEEAIRIYLGIGKNEYPCFYDLSNTNRQLIGQGESVRINSITIMDKSEAIYYSGEKMRVCIEWESKINVNNLRIYFVFCTLAKGGIGITQSLPCMNAVASKQYRTIFEIDVTELFAGEYQIITELFSIDESFEPVKYDHPEQKLFIKIQDEKYNGITWVPAYGNIKLSPLECVEHKII